MTLVVLAPFLAISLVVLIAVVDQGSMVVPSLLALPVVRHHYMSSEHCQHCRLEAVGRSKVVERSAVVVVCRWSGQMTVGSRQEAEESSSADDLMLLVEEKSVAALLVHPEGLKDWSVAVRL